MPVARAGGGKKVSAQKAFPHHVLPATYALCDPLEVLAGRQSELKLDLVKKMKGIRAGGGGAIARHLNEIAEVSFVNSWRCWGAAALQSAPS